jgi:hypothetical protein
MYYKKEINPKSLKNIFTLMVLEYSHYYGQPYGFNNDSLGLSSTDTQFKWKRKGGTHIAFFSNNRKVFMELQGRRHSIIEFSGWFFPSLATLCCEEKELRLQNWLHYTNFETKRPQLPPWWTTNTKAKEQPNFNSIFEKLKGNKNHLEIRERFENQTQYFIPGLYSSLENLSNGLLITIPEFLIKDKNESK